MSGGAVLNDKGELIGIHGKADLDTKEIKTGFNLGISINTFLRLSAKDKINIGVSAPTLVATAPRAANFLLQGWAKYLKGDKKGAITDYNQALLINPNYCEVYMRRGKARFDLGDKNGAIADYNQALQINPNYALTYIFPGDARSDLGDKEGARADFQKAYELMIADGSAFMIQDRLNENLRQAILRMKKAAEIQR